SVTAKLVHAKFIFFNRSDFRPYSNSAMFSFVLFLIAMKLQKRKIPDELFRPLVASAVFCVLSFVCISASGKDYPHYALLELTPLAMLMGMLFLAGRHVLTENNDRQTEPT